jgi:hypothetical protein
MVSSKKSRNRNQLEPESNVTEWEDGFSVAYILTSRLARRQGMRELLIGYCVGQGRVMQLPKW